MFYARNRAVLAELGHARDHAMAARGADQFLRDLGISYRALPAYFRVDQATYDLLGAATLALVNAQQKLVAHLGSTRSPEELAAMFRVPAAMAPRIDWRRAAADRFGMLRADIIPTETGYYFCELNHFSGVGAGESHHSAKVFAELLGHSVAGVSPFRELADHYARQCAELGLDRVVILDSVQHREFGYGEHRLLKDYLRLIAPDIEVHYHDETTYPADWLRPEQARRILVHRLITFYDTTDDGAFLSAVDDSGATVSCMFEAELKMHRKWLSLLCDPAYHHLLDAEEVLAIRRHVPLTFDLRPDNVDQVIGDKDGYTFKLSYSYGGKGVLIGAQHSADSLRAQIMAEGVESWTCQKLVATSTLDVPMVDGGSVPHHVVLGMFVYGGRPCGLSVRGSAGSRVVNVSNGGGVSWAFVE